MTLTEFLLKRIAEDEDLARWAGGDETTPSPSREWTWDPSASEVMWWPPDDPDHADVRKLLGTTEYDRPHGPKFSFAEQYAGEHIARHDPARVLAECDAKRRIVDMHKSYTVRTGSMLPGYCVACGQSSPCETLLTLALPYSDHKDFKPEWRV